MSTIKNIIKHVRTKKTIYFIIGLFIVLRILFAIRVYFTIPKKKRNKIIPISIKDIDVHKISNCPDYWDIDFTNGQLNSGICNNTNHLGTCNISQMDFNAYLNTSEPGKHNNLFNLKKKCKWAKKCNLTWDILDTLCE